MLDVPATAQHETYRYLRDRILDAELPAEALINPAEIAEHLGISRMPVREALRQLDAEGLVSMRPNRRAVVTRLSVAEVEDLFEMRAHSCSNVRQRAKSGRPLRWQSVSEMITRLLLLCARRDVLSRWVICAQYCREKSFRVPSS
jgi:DNA-binding GntR family transcriptional regulator